MLHELQAPFNHFWAVLRLLNVNGDFILFYLFNISSRGVEDVAVVNQ